MEHDFYCSQCSACDDLAGLQRIMDAIGLQAAFIMGWTKARTPGRVRSRGRIIELVAEVANANARRIAEFDRAKAMMLSYEDLLADAYRQRNEAQAEAAMANQERDAVIWELRNGH